MCTTFVDVTDSILIAFANAPTLYLNKVLLEEVEEYKYLGVLIDRNLSWPNHITKVCKKARKIIGLSYRQFYSNSSPDNFKQLYLSLVHPQLEYAAQTWDPFTQKEISKLESVQKFAFKMISHQ